MTVSLDSILAIPEPLRRPLLSEYDALLSAYVRADWEKVGLKAGKICEIVYTILEGHTSGTFASAPSKPANMQASCIAFERLDAAKFSRSVRIQIPRMLIAVYELRNNRAIGHVSGEIDPNRMDGEFFARAVKWLLAELVRVFHSPDIEQARQIVEVISERAIPIIWQDGDIRRVLDPTLEAKDKVLLLLYHATGKIPSGQLFKWTEHTHVTRFRKDVLGGLHRSKLIEFDQRADTVVILPPGERYVEENLELDPGK
jgi:hypothetical protein